jgi:hypothetical protein
MIGYNGKSMNKCYIPTNDVSETLKISYSNLTVSCNNSKPFKF